MKKVLLFTHESDIDGIGCAVLAKLAFENIEFVFEPNIEHLEETFRDYIQSGKLNEYDIIYVTDLALYDPSLTMVAESDLKDKVLVLDHHERAINSNMNRYPFTKIVEEDEIGKRCATELFYECLTQEGFLKRTNAIEDFVEMTRLEDTWEWKEDTVWGEKAHDLAVLFNIIGLEKYIDNMTLKLTSAKEGFQYNEEELTLIKERKEEYKKLLESIMSQAEYFIDEKNNKFGIVFADYEFRNELPEFIINIGNPENIKYIIIVAMNKGEFGQKSYRSIDENFDVNEIAMLHGGGGHPQAAAVNITKEQKEKILLLEKNDGLKYIAKSKYNKI